MLIYSPHLHNKESER